MKKSKENYYEQFSEMNIWEKIYMERHKELNSYQTFICIKYTYANT